ncbi:MAG: hypothetical protein ACLP9L_10530 [Thermoguttaceae bacterium]
MRICREAAFASNGWPNITVLVLAAGLLATTLAMLVRESLCGAPGCGPGNDLGTVRTFQRMAGGLGLGANVRPRWCFVNFDPRIEHCTCAEQPLAGGYCYCPEHAGTVSFFAHSSPVAATPSSTEP